MKPFAVLLLGALFVANGALAQDSSVVSAPQLDFEQTYGSTNDAQSDWFAKFLHSDSPADRPVWQVEPDDDFSVYLDNDSRWALNFDVRTRPQNSPLPREEMKAGATFKITPRFSIGGDVSVGADELDDSSQWEDQDVEAGIRLRSAFKF